MRESVLDAASNKEGAIDRADFERLAAAIKEEAVADYEAKQAMVAKLGRSKNRVRYFGAAAGCLVLSIGLLIPILLGILQLSKDTFIEAAGAVQAACVAYEPRLAEAVNPPNALHVTLAVTRLDDEAAQRAALGVLGRLD